MTGSAFARWEGESNRHVDHLDRGPGRWSGVAVVHRWLVGGDQIGRRRIDHGRLAVPAAVDAVDAVDHRPRVAAERLGRSERAPAIRTRCQSGGGGRGSVGAGSVGGRSRCIAVARMRCVARRPGRLTARRTRSAGSGLQRTGIRAGPGVGSSALPAAVGIAAGKSIGTPGVGADRRRRIDHGPGRGCCGTVRSRVSSTIGSSRCIASGPPSRSDTRSVTLADRPGIDPL